MLNLFIPRRDRKGAFRESRCLHDENHRPNVRLHHRGNRREYRTASNRLPWSWLGVFRRSYRSAPHIGFQQSLSGHIVAPITEPDFIAVDVRPVSSTAMASLVSPWPPVAYALGSVPSLPVTPVSNICSPNPTCYPEVLHA